GAGLAAGLRPRVLNAALSFGLRLLRRPPLSQRLTAGAIRGPGLSFLGAWLLLGAHIWILAAALGRSVDAWEMAQAAVFGYPLAAAVGILVIPLPVGLGLREFILVVVLAGSILEPTAIAVGLVSRLIVTLADVLVAGAGWGMSRWSVDRARALAHPESEDPAP
ncbi:MAG: hypothetical protein ACRC0L_03885, partial [Angustibacter sp.]